MKKATFKPVTNTVLILFTIMIGVLLSSCSPNNDKQPSSDSLQQTTSTDNQSNPDSKNELIPSNILVKGIDAFAEIEVLCNTNGIPINLRDGEERINDEGNWVIERKVSSRDDQHVFLVYDSNGFIQSANITFLESGNDDDFFKFQKIMYYILQVNELFIPVDEANNVIQHFNDNLGKSFWQFDSTNREYTYMIDTETGFLCFIIEYKY